MPTVTLSHLNGGTVQVFYAAFQYWLEHGYAIAIDGLCASACTLALMFPPDRLCVTPRAVLEFHEASDGPNGFATMLLWTSYPQTLKARLGALTDRVVTLRWPETTTVFRPC